MYVQSMRIVDDYSATLDGIFAWERIGQPRIRVDYEPREHTHSIHFGIKKTTHIHTQANNFIFVVLMPPSNTLYHRRL